MLRYATYKNGKGVILHLICSGIKSLTIKLEGQNYIPKFWSKVCKKGIRYAMNEKRLKISEKNGF